MKMDPRIKALWVERLLSGKYPQGRNILHQLPEHGEDGVGRFCCYGVLCEIAKEEGVITSVPAMMHEVYDGDTAHIPLKVRTWAWGPDGEWMDEFGPLVQSPTHYDGSATTRSLVSLNDSGVSFPEIAKLIEENF